MKREVIKIIKEIGERKKKREGVCTDHCNGLKWVWGKLVHHHIAQGESVKK